MIARYAIEFFFFMSLVVVPAVLALLCRWLVPRRYWRWAALASTLLIWAVVAYGYFVGFRQLVVRHVEYASSDLPAVFDGFRIVQFSDAHVETYSPRGLRRAIDSINAQKPDLVVFTGDMLNVYATEMMDYHYLLDYIDSKYGVVSVLGNHDYPIYSDLPKKDNDYMLRMVKRMENEPRNWTLLLNEHRVVRRGTDSLVIAGMENWGTVKRMPREGDVRKTLEGVTDSAFVVMLQHDPTAWRAKILPECHAQLTLSGHTHGGQFSLWGWSPAALAYDEWGGMYREGDRAMYVSTGLGGLIPFRLNLPGEIVVITLKSKKR
ncbi:MAG: metallophosphoesterase [Prevotella sp.]|nr:metallophosphoesterase [Prevotella sp.]